MVPGVLAQRHADHACIVICLHYHHAAQCFTYKYRPYFLFVLSSVVELLGHNFDVYNNGATSSECGEGGANSLQILFLRCTMQQPQLPI